MLPRCVTGCYDVTRCAICYYVTRIRHGAIRYDAVATERIASLSLQMMVTMFYHTITIRGARDGATVTTRLLPHVAGRVRHVRLVTSIILFERSTVESCCSRRDIAVRECAYVAARRAITVYLPRVLSLLLSPDVAVVRAPRDA